MKERCGSPDDLEVSMDRLDKVDIMPFVNSFDIFCEKAYRVVELFTTMKINAWFLLNAPPPRPQLKF